MKRGLGLLVLCAVGACGGRPLDAHDAGMAGDAGRGGGSGTVGRGGAPGVAGRGGEPGLGGGAGAEPDAGPVGEAGSTPGNTLLLTEWRVPFADSEPFQIAAVESGVVYLNKGAEQHLGLVNVLNGMVSEWPLPYVATSPGGIEVRSSDGAVFVTGATLGEIGQFDPATQVLRRWHLPVETPTDAGPFSLAIAGDGRVYFAALESGTREDSQVLIGRLETGVGLIEMWNIPEHTTPRVVAGPNGTVFFNLWGGVGRQGIGRLDTATGVFTMWPLGKQLAYPAAADGNGNVFVQIVDSTFQGVARLVPDSGWLAEWETGGEGGDCLVFSSVCASCPPGRLFFGRADIMSLRGLDPTVPGRDVLVTPVVHPAIKARAFLVTPTTTTLTAERALATIAQRFIRSQISGAFEDWPISGQPRMIAATAATIYVTEDGAPTIARIARASE